MQAWIRPRPLEPGQTIGVVAPSNSVREMRDQVETGIAALELLGYRVRRGRHLYGDWLGLGGTHAERAEDWNAMLRDPEVRMVMAAEGGFGCLSIVDALDYAAFAADPKWVSGMSDLTIFLNALGARARVETLHGPDVAFSFGLPAMCEVETPWFIRAVQDPSRPYRLPLGPVRVLRRGSARGRMFGGTLSVFGFLLGTPFAPPLEDAVLVLEGYGLTTANLHRWLQLLRLQGHLLGLRGLVLGTWSECMRGDPDPQGTLETLVRDACHGTDFPIIQVDRIGHGTPNVPWPVGAGAEISEAGIELL